MIVEYRRSSIDAARAKKLLWKRAERRCTE